MFKQLFSALKSEAMMDRAFAEFSEMLEHARWMFTTANDVLCRTVNAESVRESLYQQDQAINDLLRSIRRKIVRHLTINPGSDIPPGLALISVAKDAERIGDYCKNVFEVGRFYTEQFNVPRYHEPLEEIRHETEDLFDAAQDAWRQSSKSGAKKAIRSADSIIDRCDRIIEQLLSDRQSIQTHEAVAYSLLARHYKRVAAHLANISTAVLGRIEDLDFRH